MKIYDVRLGLPVRVAGKSIQDPYYSGFIAGEPKIMFGRLVVDVSFHDGDTLFWEITDLVPYKEGYEI